MAANPTSESELQLYRVLQRANLLQYFETFISQGGDDVQQLCEAGEEEFLEIMALVGMASKPLHVRRLQKVLQEWISNPGVFHQPLGPHTPPPPIAPGSILASVQRPYLKMAQPGTLLPKGGTTWTPPENIPVDGQVSAIQNIPCSLSPGSAVGVDVGVYSNDGMLGMAAVGSGQPQQQQSQQQQQQAQQQQQQQQQMNYLMDSPESCTANSSLLEERNGLSPGANPQLTDAQVAAIAKAAEELAKTLPEYEPKQLSAKKLINKEIEEVMKLPVEHPERLDLLRKYGCIYGRFDSRRKNEKQLSLHEISVNEASAQLCKHRVTLLTRRDDLFPLARQVVRDSGYQYSKGHSRGQNVEIPPNKKPKLESFMFEKQVQEACKASYLSPQKGQQKGASPTDEKQLRDMRMAEINRELTTITARQQSLKCQISQGGGEAGSEDLTAAQGELQGLMTRQLQLLTEQSDLLRRQRSLRRSQYQESKAGGKGDSQDDDDEDSMPFPTEAFPTNVTEEEFFNAISTSSTSKNSPTDYSQGGNITALQQYTLGENPVTIKQEVEDVSSCSGQNNALEPGEVQTSIRTISWPMVGKRAFGLVSENNLLGATSTGVKISGNADTDGASDIVVSAEANSASTKTPGKSSRKSKNTARRVQQDS